LFFGGAGWRGFLIGWGRGWTGLGTGNFCEPQGQRPRQAMAAFLQAAKQELL
jgi:hypothetical protein